jgi:hypothetical protein
MNLEKATYLKQTAKRTIKIIELLEQGLEVRQIMEVLSNFRPMVERALVEYYKKVLK